VISTNEPEDQSDYYIAWIQALGEPAATPVLLDVSREMKMGVKFETTSLDIACGILHEYWKPIDPEIHQPSKEQLLAIYTKIIRDDFNDTVLNSIGGITVECRKAFGHKASLNQLFSAYSILPSDPDIKQNLMADIISIFINGKTGELSENELAKVFSVINEIYTDFPVDEHGEEIGFQVARIYLMALCINGSITKTLLFINETIKKLNLNNQKAQELRDLVNSVPHNNFNFTE
jgi:hypothetical protein